jgi:hypothetical protein
MRFNKFSVTVHAYLCADGYVIQNPPTRKNKYYYIGFRNTTDVLLDDFDNNFNRAFKILPRRGKDGRCIVQNKTIYLLLTKDYSYYSYEWRMPSLRSGLLKYWLRAYFDCEGWVISAGHQNRSINADCVNLKGLKQVRAALRVLGIYSIIRKRNERNIYTLSIYRKASLVLFQERIGFLHPLKSDKLQKAINSYVDYNWILKDIHPIKSIFISKEVLPNSKRIRICSKLQKNIINLQKLLVKEGIHAIVSGARISGNGTVYYELSINVKKDILRLHDLLKY